jgi:LysM repeat protein
MKRISLLLALIAMSFAFAGRSQDAATEERFNKLAGQIEDLIAAQRSQQKQIEALAKEIESLRERANRPAAEYATPDDVKRLADALREVDRKRIEDSEKISAQFAKLGQKLSSPALSAPRSSSKSVAENSAADKPVKDDKAFPYTIESGDTLSMIVQAYRDKNIKVSLEQILAANPGLKPDKLRPGQKIWIPAP